MSDETMIALVSGGLGVAPMLLAARDAEAAGLRVVWVHGARTAAELSLEWKGDRVVYATDDGSRGVHGSAVAAVGLFLLATASSDTTFFAQQYPWLLALNAALAALPPCKFLSGVFSSPPQSPPRAAVRAASGGRRRRRSTDRAVPRATSLLLPPAARRSPS